MATLPYLPTELHAEIRESLHHYRDRSTLLSAALVNKEWSKGCQRILFSKMIDHLYDRLDLQKKSVTSTHTRFLQVIVEHPRRLGPLVHSYAQHCLASNAAAVGRREWWGSEADDLWELTERALPAMVNLKHLYLEPLDDDIPPADNWVSSSALLNSFTFQLETFIWKCYYNPDHGLSEFLRTQNNLRHLETSFTQNDLTCQMLDDSICQSLISSSGCFHSLEHLAQSRKIIAWKWYASDDEAHPQDVAQGLSALGHLKYLSVDEFKALPIRHAIGPIDLNIILLELGDESWDVDTLKSLSNMPKLRVLVLLGDKYRRIGSQEITRAAIDCFKQLPSLECIIHRYHLENGDGYRYWKLTLSLNSTEDILREEVLIDYDVGAAWWTLYNV